MKFGADMSQLTEYVNQLGNADIIRALAGSAPSIQYFEQQLGVNEKTDIHLMATEVNFKDGRNCGFSDDNSFSFSDRQIDPAFIKTEDEICADKMLGKWLGYANRYTANGNELPFSQIFVEEYVKATAKSLENVIWNGITVGAKKHDGLADIVKAEGTKVPVAKGADAFEQVEALVMALPEASAAETEFFVSPKKMLALRQALLKRDFRLIDLNFSNGAEADEHTIKLPVYGVLVHEVSGLSGDDNVYALVPNHTVYGTSVEGSHTDVKLSYSDREDSWIMRIKLSVGVQVAYPGETLYAEVAAE